MRTQVPFGEAPVTIASTRWPYARGEQQGGRGLAHLPLHLRRVVLLQGAVAGQVRQLVHRVGGEGLPAIAALTRRCVARSGKRRFGAVECV